MSANSSSPIEADEAAGLFAPLLRARAGEPIALAVSGGSDSTALMVLFGDWVRREGADPARHTVLTVNHGLRAEAAGEARLVAKQAAGLGFRHVSLAWEGEKPHAGVQAAARQARYRLMGDYLAVQGIGTLLTGHTSDDQAETLLMRLARGSGLDGLAGIAPSIDLQSLPGGAPVRILRPLLEVPKSRLEATLRQRGVTWSEDPSNHAPKYERSRLRAARAGLEALGLTSEMLALSARRLRRSREAIDAVTEAACTGGGGVVETDRCGYFRIHRGRLERMPDEVFLRIVGCCIAAAGGSGEPVPLAKLELAVSGLRCRGNFAPDDRTLARAHIVVEDEFIQIEREPGRVPLPVMRLVGSTTALWDGRFAVANGPGLDGSLEVRALGRAGLAQLGREGQAVARSRPLLLVPGFWRGEQLLAVPSVDFWAESALEGQISATFLGLRYNL